MFNQGNIWNTQGQGQQQQQWNSPFSSQVQPGVFTNAFLQGQQPQQAGNMNAFNNPMQIQPLMGIRPQLLNQQNQFGVANQTPFQHSAGNPFIQQQAFAQQQLNPFIQHQQPQHQFNTQFAHQQSNQLNQFDDPPLPFGYNPVIPKALKNQPPLPPSGPPKPNPPPPLLDWKVKSPTKPTEPERVYRNPAAADRFAPPPPPPPPPPPKENTNSTSSATQANPASWQNVPGGSGKSNSNVPTQDGIPPANLMDIIINVVRSDPNIIPGLGDLEKIPFIKNDQQNSQLPMDPKTAEGRYNSTKLAEKSVKPNQDQKAQPTPNEKQGTSATKIDERNQPETQSTGSETHSATNQVKKQEDKGSSIKTTPRTSAGDGDENSIVDDSSSNVDLVGINSSGEDGRAPVNYNKNSLKIFDKKFRAWEKQFEDWKLSNQHHPDKSAYKTYMDQWDAWRQQLIKQRRSIIDNINKKRLDEYESQNKPDKASTNSSVCTNEKLETSHENKSETASKQNDKPEKAQATECEGTIEKEKPQPPINEQKSDQDDKVKQHTLATLDNKIENSMIVPNPFATARDSKLGAGPPVKTNFPKPLLSQEELFKQRKLESQNRKQLNDENDFNQNRQHFQSQQSMQVSHFNSTADDALGRKHFQAKNYNAYESEPKNRGLDFVDHSTLDQPRFPNQKAYNQPGFFNQSRNAFDEPEFSNKSHNIFAQPGFSNQHDSYNQPGFPNQSQIPFIRPGFQNQNTFIRPGFPNQNQNARNQTGFQNQNALNQLRYPGQQQDPFNNRTQFPDQHQQFGRETVVDNNNPFCVPTMIDNPFCKQKLAELGLKENPFEKVYKKSSETYPSDESGNDFMEDAQDNPLHDQAVQPGFTKQGLRHDHHGSLLVEGDTFGHGSLDGLLKLPTHLDAPLKMDYFKENETSRRNPYHDPTAPNVIDYGHGAGGTYLGPIEDESECQELEEEEEDGDVVRIDYGHGEKAPIVQAPPSLHWETQEQQEEDDYYSEHMKYQGGDYIEEYSTPAYREYHPYDRAGPPPERGIRVAPPLREESRQPLLPTPRPSPYESAPSMYDYTEHHPSTRGPRAPLFPIQEHMERQHRMELEVKTETAILSSGLVVNIPVTDDSIVRKAPPRDQAPITASPISSTKSLALDEDLELDLDRSNDRESEKDRAHDRSRDRERRDLKRSRDRERDPEKRRDASDRGRSRDREHRRESDIKSKDDVRPRERETDRVRERDRALEKSRNRERGRSRSRERGRSHSRERGRSHSRERVRSSDHDRSRNKPRSPPEDADRIRRNPSTTSPSHRRKSSPHTGRRSRSPVSLNVSNTKPSQQYSQPKYRTILIEDLLNLPGRNRRPSAMVIILRGLPGSGKSFVAKLIKEREVKNGGPAPRILSLDDYFITKEIKRVSKDPATGKEIETRNMEYEYDREVEARYRDDIIKIFKKTVDNGYFKFIVIDCINDKLRYFNEIVNYANQRKFQVYIAETEANITECCLNNIHNRTRKDIEYLQKNWEQLPSHLVKLDVRTLLQDDAIQDVEMEDVSDIDAADDEIKEKKIIEDNSAEVEVIDLEEEDEPTWAPSKWETSEEKLNKLDGLAKKKKVAETTGESSQGQSMGGWLKANLSEEYFARPDEPGKKRVRWADVEERREQERAREIGFVVGQTNWNRLTDPTFGSSALTRTKFI